MLFQARKSLKLFPLPLYTGRDCKILTHFGDKLCDMLDKKLKKYQDEYGPIDWKEVHEVGIFDVICSWFT